MQETFYTVPGCPVLVAQVSDLHERPYDDVITSLQRNRPDLICVTGDFFFGVMPRTQTKAEESGMLSFFAACAELAPCFVSLGNHEWLISPEDITLIARTGVHILDNACTVCTVKGAQLVIGGLSSGAASAGLRLAGEGIDLRTPYLYEQLKKVPPVTDWLDAFCSTPGYRVLLCHHPEYYPRYCTLARGSFLRARDFSRNTQAGQRTAASSSAEALPTARRYRACLTRRRSYMCADNFFTRIFQKFFTSPGQRCIIFQ